MGNAPAAKRLYAAAYASLAAARLGASMVSWDAPLHAPLLASPLYAVAAVYGYTGMFPKTRCTSSPK